MRNRQPLPITPLAHQVALADIDDAGACQHSVCEVFSTNGRNLDGARRKCVSCGEWLSDDQLNPPVPRSNDAISQALAARETIATLEAKRTEHVGGEWSPSQHVRRAS